MESDFIKGLPISDDERTRLASFGAKSPLMLLGMRKASKQAFDECFGERAQFIADELEKLLSPEELKSLSEAPNVPGNLGARLNRVSKRSIDG